MTRAKRIEEAARALLHRLSKTTSDTFAPEEDALEDALALPEEESVRVWANPAEFDDRCFEVYNRDDPPLSNRLVACRITVEGEESER